MSYILEKLRRRLSRARSELDNLYYKAAYWHLTSSMLKVVKDYHQKIEEDTDCFALIAALHDFQMPVPRLINTFEDIVNYLQERGISILELEDPLKAVGSVHRFDREGRVFKWLIKILNNIDLRQEAERLYREKGVEGLIRGILATLHTSFKDLFSKRAISPKNEDLFKRFVPSPNSMSTLKRMCLFLRWVARREYPDLGLWNFINQSELLIPLDAGIARVLGRIISERIPQSWKAVVSLTSVFKSIKPSDPVRYDFPISRIAILGLCRPRLEQCNCYVCPLSIHCDSSQPKEVILRERKTPEHNKILEYFVRWNPWRTSCTSEYRLDGTADIVCFEPSIKDPRWIYVAEVKVKAEPDSIAQVLRYGEILKKRYPKSKLKAIAIVAREISPQTLELAGYRGIQVWIWREDKRIFRRLQIPNYDGSDLECQ